jgi:hypothetical protein
MSFTWEKNLGFFLTGCAKVEIVSMGLFVGTFTYIERGGGGVNQYETIFTFLYCIEIIISILYQ